MATEAREAPDVGRLRECSWCGSAQWLDVHCESGLEHRVVCTACRYCAGPHGENEQEARAAWNNRATDPAMEALSARATAAEAALETLSGLGVRACHGTKGPYEDEQDAEVRDVATQALAAIQQALRGGGPGDG